MKKIKQVAGFIVCRRLNKKFNISVDARPLDENRPDFLCECGRWVKMDPYYHDCMWKGRKVI